MVKKKRIALIGSTGFIGKKTLQVVQHLAPDMEITCLAAKSDIETLYVQALAFHPQLIAVFDHSKAYELGKRLPDIPVLGGLEGIQAAAAFDGADFTLLAMTGSLGLLPAAAAIRARKQIGLANKEVLACGGEWITGLAKEHQVELLPVDSEHSALHQCLKGEDRSAVRRLILTASGGAFRNKTFEQLKQATPAEALAHPNWVAGAKCSVDCSTLMNKGLEMIQSKFLFGIASEKIEAVIHPQSRIHSCVEFVDGSILAQMAEADMALPIQYALTYPERKTGPLPPYDFFKNGCLTFSPPDFQRFPCLKIAIEAMKAGQSYPCFLNAVNEVLVSRFLEGKIRWTCIGEILDELISSHCPQDVLTLEAILAVDASAREVASARCSALSM